MKTKDIVIGAMIGAVYVALNLLLIPSSYGPVQFRVAEALTILPLVFPSAIGGIFVGCIISNFFGGYGIIDIVFGSLASLIAAYTTYFIGKKIKNPKTAAVLGGIPPIIINAVVMGLVLTYATTNTADAAPFYIFASQIFISQTGVVYVIGIPLLYLIKKLNLNKYQT